MLIIQSETYGTITVPFTWRTRESYSANVSQYARDNTTDNTRTSVSSGSVINPPSYQIDGIINDNDGFFFNRFNIAEIRRLLVKLYNDSELFTMIIGVSNAFALLQNDPLSISDCVIKSMDIVSDRETGKSYNLSMTVSSVILVNTIYNPDIVNIKPNKGNAKGTTTNLAKTSLTPANNGNANSATVTWADVKSAWGAVGS